MQSSNLPNVLTEIIQSYIPVKKAGFYSRSAIEQKLPLYLFTSIEGNNRVATHVIMEHVDLAKTRQFKDWLFSGILESDISPIEICAKYKK